jgi:hypothetical protein
MGVGIRTIYRVPANVATASDIVLNTIGLTAAIAANQIMKIKAWIPFTVGATGGIQFQIVCPAAIGSIVSTSKFVNTGAPAIVTAVQVTSVAVGNAVANAGNHWLEIEAEIVNGVNAGTVDIQVCQNTSDVLTMTVLKGATMEVVTE